jgi:glycosyltransferase involved in cell wall biosynthesis
MQSVAAFTDTYLPTVNGVTYTVESWRDRWRDRGGRMDVVYPEADGYDPTEGEYPVSSLPFPFYDGFRFGLPQIPDGVSDADVVHAHTPFSLGLAARRLAHRDDRPLVASYHTPTGEYASYLTVTSWAPTEPLWARLSEAYERWFFSRADAVVVPSEPARSRLLEVGLADCEDPPTVEVVPNGVDTERFRPRDGAAFRERFSLGDGPLVGYTGRHGYEKNLEALLAAAAPMDVTVVFGGDGPARSDLEAAAARWGADARFLGFLDRADLPGFYSALDVFGFPSPVETQGLVALEAIACGTPVVAVDEGALSETVDHGRTGYHYPHGDVEGFRAALRRGLAEREPLREQCLAARESISVSHAVDRLVDVYAALE